MSSPQAEFVAEFTDKYGDKRKITRLGRKALRIENKVDSVSHKMNRVAARMIGNKIKEKRLEAKLGLEELCELAGLGAAIPKNRMWEIENSIRSTGVRTGTLYALAKALGCEVKDFLPSVSEVAELAGVKLVATTSLTVVA